MSGEVGPIYNVTLINELPLSGGMIQAFPNRAELELARKQGRERVVAAFEVLTWHYRKQVDRVAELERSNQIDKQLTESGESACSTDEETSSWRRVAYALQIEKLELLECLRIILKAKTEFQDCYYGTKLVAAFEGAAELVKQYEKPNANPHFRPQ
jgi:hypothetical protein